MRKFLAALFGVKDAPVRRPPADPLHTLYQNGCILLDRMYAGETWSRRSMQNRMSQGEWNRAFSVIKRAGLVDSRDRFIPRYSSTEAESLIRNIINEERKKLTNRNYVPPF